MPQYTTDPGFARWREPHASSGFFIVASVQSSNSSEHWRFTKNLRICIHTSLADAPALARALHRVQHVISDMEELEQLINGHAGFRPTRFTCTSMFYPMFWTRVFSSITHLHLATDGWNWAARGPPLPLPLEAALTHVVVQICPQFAAAVLPWFFASPTVQRVAVWEARWFRGTVHVPLDAFAKTHLDRRIRLIGDEERLPLVMTGDVQHPAQPDELDPSLPNLIYPYLPDVLTFDPALWEIGKELRW